MEEYDQVLAGYGFADNKGYGSAEHIAALRKLGPTPIHRRTFIKKFCLKKCGVFRAQCEKDETKQQSCRHCL